MITQEGFDPWVYDIDEDCYISAAEKDQAVADWQSGKITMSNALAVVNLWEWSTRNPACGVPPTCLVDADCPEGYVCQNGVCVKKKAFPWYWLAIGGAAIAGVILLIRKPKKTVKKK